MTHDFERFLTRGIPFHEAADFYLRIKKAGWADAPDETGALEGQFTVPVEQVVAAITEIVTNKFKLMVAYHVYAESMRGLAQHPIGEVFHEHAEHERAAAEAYLKRAAVLGSGPVHLPEIETPPASSDPVGIIMILARAEQEAIAAQAALRQMVGDVNPIGFQIEQFMIEDQHHLDELWQMLPQDQVRTPVIDQPVEGGETEEAAPPAPEAKPEQPAAKEASGLQSFRRSFKAVPMEGAASAIPGDANVWSKLEGAVEGLTPSARMALLGGGLGAAGGVALGSAESLESPEAKQQRLEDSGPIGRFQMRHPIATRAASMGAAGALGGKGISDLSELIIGTRGNPSGKQLMKVMPTLLAPTAAGIVAGGVDSDLHKREVEELAKGASAKDHIKMLGAKMRAGAKRYGELLSGSKAKDLAVQANRGFLSAHRAAKSAIEGSRSMGPVEKRRVADTVRSAMEAARTSGDKALRENTKSRVTQVATGAAGLGAVGVAAHSKHKKDMQKIDRTNALLKKAFVHALYKIGFSAPEPGMGTDPGSAPMPDTKPGVAPMPSMLQPGVQPPMQTPPGMGQYAPINYIEAEETARRAQADNEAGFYRSQAEQAASQVQSMGQQIAGIQAQLDQVSAQAAEGQNQIMAANEEASRANDQMLNQATLAARMRMGMQQLRAQMMEIASQDPEQLAAAAGGPTPMDVGMQAQQAAAGPASPADPNAAPGAQPGTPGASADPGSPPGSPPEGSGGPPGSGGGPDESKNSEGESAPAKKDSGGETTVSIKKGSAPIFNETMRKLPLAAGGALIGAGAGYLHAKKGGDIPQLRERVDALKGQQDGGFGKSVELAKANLALAEAEEARMNPARSAISGGLLGASLGIGLGTAIPAAASGGQQLFKNLREVASNMRGA